MTLPRGPARTFGCVLGLVLTACPAATVRTVPQMTASVAADPLAGLDDASSLADAARRLCTEVATAAQRALGHRAATRALAKAPGDRTSALALARCAYLIADWESDGKALLAVTKAGVDAADAAGARRGDTAAAYARALNLGLNIRERGLEALGLVNELIADLKSAGREPAQDQGGPLRVLGMLYLNAPAWPVGPGDLEAALELLREASTRYPGHPQNRLFLAQALIQADDKKAAATELAAARALALPELWGDYAARWQGEIALYEAQIPTPR